MMTLLIVLAVLYGLITVIVAGGSVIDYHINRDYARDTAFEESRVEAERDARRAAKRFVRSPLWPLMVIDAIVRMLAAAREPEDR